MRVVFDNNIWISFLIGKRLSALRPVFHRPDVEIYYCEALEQEYLDVSHRPKIMKYADEQQIERVHLLMTDSCRSVEVVPQNNTSVRDPKDVYLLTLCETAKVDVLVTGDADLLALGQNNLTKIVAFEEALSLLGI